MSQVKPVDAASSPQPKSANSAAVVIVLLVILAVMVIPVILGGLVVAGGMFTFLAVDKGPAIHERMESMSAPAIQADMQEASPTPEFSIPVEPEPAPQP